MKLFKRISRNAVAVAVLVTMFARPGLKAQSEVEDVPAEVGKEDGEAKGEAEKHFKKTEDAVRGFLAATTVNEMSKFVRQRKRVEPLMEAYYRKNRIEPIVYKEMAEYRIVSLENRPYVALKVIDENDADYSILLEDQEDEMLVDWETFVCHQPITPEAFVKKKSTEPMSFRVYVEKDNFYAYEFDDEELYQCYRLSFRDSEALLYGFVKRGTKLDGDLGEIFSVGSKEVKPLILKLRFLEGSKSGKFVQIEGLESQLWVYVKPPEEPESP